MADEAPVHDRLRIVAHFPGRLRVRAETFRVMPEVATQVAERLRGEAGVREVTASSVTGSLLVLYEPRELQLPKLVQLIVRVGGLGGIEVDALDAWQKQEPQGDRVRALADRINEALRGQTRGQIDARVAVPGALAGSGLAMLLLGRARVPDWYDLLFWAFVTFTSLNPSDRGRHPAQERDDGGADAA